MGATLMYLQDFDTDFDQDQSADRAGRGDFQRARSPKMVRTRTRKNRAPQRGGIRLRRNKRHSW